MGASKPPRFLHQRSCHEGTELRQERSPEVRARGAFLDGSHGSIGFGGLGFGRLVDGFRVEGLGFGFGVEGST